MAIGLLTVPGRLAAEPLDPLTRQFAGCAGRLSAQMEHQWLVSDPDADRTEAQRAAMIALLEAVMPADAGRMTLAHRIEAKFAHAALLNRAAFGQDPAQARFAMRRAEAEIARCLSNLLS